MMMSLYFTLGTFLLPAARNPSAHRSLIAFTAWSSFAHAVAMGTMGLRIPELRSGFLIASALLVIITIVLIARMPPKRSAEHPTAVTA
jgi:hypothetical protein